MTREEFKVLVKGMKAVYSDPKFIADQDAFNVWYEMLKDLPYQQASTAVHKYMLTEKFPPTIADIRTKATEIVSPVEEQMSELEAWSLVYKAICNSNYHADEEFSKLPKACQRAVGNPSVLREWAMMDMDTISSVEQSHFIRNYRAAMQSMKDEAKIPDGIKQLIETIRKPAVEIAQKKSMAIDQKNDAIELEGDKSVPIPNEIEKRMNEMFKGL